jgi:hypothetical protein
MATRLLVYNQNYRPAVLLTLFGFGMKRKNNKSLKELRSLKEHSIICPCCSIRYPRLIIADHISTEHPEYSIQEKDLNKNIYSLDSGNVSTKGKRKREFSGSHKVSGGLPGLGKNK